MILASAHKIEKTYANRTLFENLSVGVGDKDRVGLVGPNGAGKSTLLAILAGRIEADAGTVSLKKGLRLGFLEQTPRFASDATVLDAILEKCADRDEALARAYELMAKLELTNKFGADHLVSELSGGWQKRVAIGRELALEPQLLLLDEPTNHLDLSSILWLEDYLSSAPFAVLMITHDRLFLQRVANRIWDLDPRNPDYILNVQGDYARYLETKELELAALARHESVQKNRLRRETEWLHRGALARQTKQSARIQAAADLKDSVANLKDKNQQRRVDLSFGEAEHAPKKLVEATGISKTFGDKILFENADILVTPNSRLGLLGDNGSGKSTLIKILLGLETPDSGRVLRPVESQVAYFEQSRETLRPDLSVLKNICPEGDFVFYKDQPLHVRSYLDRFHFSGHKVDLPVSKLSGGEQARLRLAQMMLKNCQILVLDEPTNDLDTEMLDSLEQSLEEFNGAVILVTHDRYFLDAVCNQILSFPLAESGDRRLQKFASYFQWEKWFQEESSRQASEKLKPAAAASEVIKKARLSYKEKYELENIEGTILKLEAELADLQAESVSEKTMSDHKRLSDIHSRIAMLQAEIDQRYQRWADLEARK